MAATSLTARRVELEDGSTAFPYPWKGETVPVRDSAASILEIVEAARSDGLSNAEKGALIPGMLLADPGEAFLLCDYSQAEFAELVRCALSDVCGIDAEGGGGPKVWDACEDAALVRVSLRQAYGIEWDAARDTMPWAEFASLVACLPMDTPLGRAMYYRNPDNRPTGTDEHARREQARFDELHSLFALGEGSRDNVQEASAAMDDLALALMAKAR